MVSYLALILSNGWKGAVIATYIRGGAGPDRPWGILWH